ncbi:MAG TPA: zinc dependent phospholipase C family protein, partial [Candidatus Sulfotelmatobacter sp.]
MLRIGRIILLLGLITVNAAGYSVLTHQEVIDLAWNGSIRPLLLAKFPGATEEQLREAHAYAYGGSAIQDMGYYPFGKKFFSNLTHYVRTGDFIAALFRNAHTIDEYAFAIGALSHYLGDSIGHSQAINPATAIAFPKL